ncbi:MAG: P-loop NTPase fold protein [Rhizonema sp. PD37]|nr:P-loop NTPase fold protein [Rhizonema sp. PD37]
MAQAEINNHPQDKTETDNHSQDNSPIDPQTDRLGYANFAQYLANSICNMSFAQGFAIALYGTWGSGKSTMLDFVVHYLNQKPDEERPIIVPFNPWLFSGSQDVTKRFFEQLQDILSKTTSVPKGLKERIADFANVVAEIPLPYAQAGKAVATLFDDEQKDASEIKEDVERTLLQEDRRIIITIDDIDRLAVEDIKQIFRILKAIPNFNNVIYLLAFDKKVVIRALAESQEISGEAYLEKIIQVAFELPTPDKASFQRLLFEKLESVIADNPKHLFEPTYWRKVYYQGIDHFITNLLDIIRLINNLCVTYAAVKGEVNSVDFIAIESLRVFCPTMYNIIRTNKNAFVGELNFTEEELKNLHNSWIAQLEDEDKPTVKNLLLCLFPRLEVVWGDGSYDGKQESKWHKQMRVCCPEIFPNYFRLAFSESKLAQTRAKDVLAVADDAEEFGEKLIELSLEKRPDGTTQVRAFLEMLDDNIEKEIPVENISTVVQALFDVGDQLICPEDEPTTIFDFSNKMRISRLISQLLSKLEEPERFQLLKAASSQGKALSIIVNQVETLAEQQTQFDSDTLILEEVCLISPQHLEEITEIVAKRQQEKEEDEESESQ